MAMMTSEAVIKWYEDTLKEIANELIARSVPFEINILAERLIMNSFMSCGVVPANVAYWNPQLIFTWNEADVVVGCLHFDDDEAIRGKMDKKYPSIETMGFSFDGGDVSVFDSPKEAAEAIAEEYMRYLKGAN